MSPTRKRFSRISEEDPQSIFSIFFDTEIEKTKTFYTSKIRKPSNFSDNQKDFENLPQLSLFSTTLIPPGRKQSMNSNKSIDFSAKNRFPIQDYLKGTNYILNSDKKLEIVSKTQKEIEYYNSSNKIMDNFGDSTYGIGFD